MDFFKKYSYTVKSKVLIALTVVFSFIAYFLSIHKTIVLISNNNDLTKRIYQLEKAPEQIAFYNLQLREINQEYNLENDKNQVRKLLLEKISGFCAEEDVVLQNFNEPLISVDHNIQVENYRIDLQGEYVNILKVVNLIENNMDLCNPVSVKFELRKDIRNKRTYLVSSLVLQITQQYEEI